MNPETAKYIVSIMQFKNAKVGDVFTERHVEAIEFLWGDMFRKLGPAKKICDIRFTENGSALVVEGAENVRIVESEK